MSKKDVAIENLMELIRHEASLHLHENLRHLTLDNLSELTTAIAAALEEKESK